MNWKLLNNIIKDGNTFLLSTKGGRNFVRVFEGSGKNRRQAQRTIVDPAPGLQHTGKERKIYSVKKTKMYLSFHQNF